MEDGDEDYFKYRGADESLAQNQEGNKLMFLIEWHEFPSAPCLAGKTT